MSRLSVQEIESRIRVVPDFPKKGIMFMDLTTAFNDTAAFQSIIDTLYDHYKGMKVNHVAGIEARGLILASALAYKLGCGMTMIRKPGKLPAETVSESYALEYGTNEIHVHKDAFRPGDHVLLVDDLLATGGTMKAAINLVEKLEAKVAGVAFVVELAFLNGMEKLKGYDCYSMIVSK